MNVSHKLGLVVCLLSLCWGACLTLLLRSFPVGMHLAPTERVGICAVTVHPDGREVESERKFVESEGVVSFGIDRKAKSFYFKLFPAGEGVRGTAGLVSIDVLGIPILPSDSIPNFDIRKKIYGILPDPGSPLSLGFKSGDPLDLPNVFPFLCHFASALLSVVAWLPLGLILIYAACRTFGHAALRKCRTVLDNGVVFAFILVVAIVLSMPPPVTMVTPGLDPSWVWLFNRFAFSGQIGTDFVFTYGPLGFMICPQYSLLNVCVGIAVNGLFSLLFAVVVWLLYRGGSGTAERNSSFLLLALWCLAWPNGMEWKWYAVSLVSLFLALLRCDFPRTIRCALVAGAALSAVVQSFVKISSCFMIISQHAFIFMMLFIVVRARPWRELWIYTATSAVALAGGVALLFPDLGSAAEWLVGSVQISSGYNLYMGGEKSWFEIAFVLVLVAGVVFAVICGRQGRRARLVHWMMLAPTGYLAFKYAIVRQSLVPLAFIASLWACLCLASRASSLKRTVVTIAFCAGLSWMVLFLMYRDIPKVSLSPANALSAVNPLAALHECATRGGALIAKARLPDSWLSQIGTNRVMIVGDEMGPAMAGELNLVPFPATQTYSAYTPYLDALCAKRIAELDLQYLLVPANPRSFDSRNIYFDNPRLWNLIRRNYEYCASGEMFVLLHRRVHPLDKKGNGTTFDLKRSLMGKVLSLSLRTPRTKACFRFDGGTEYTCSANVEILDGTDIPEFLPLTRVDVPPFFGGDGKCPKIVDIRIVPADSLQLDGKFLYGISNIAAPTHTVD